MVYITFSPYLSLDACKKLYKEIINDLSLRSILMKYLSCTSLVKNGIRKKVYRYGNSKELFEIQRMVMDYKVYFDFFPLFLIPNSTALFENLVDYEKDKMVSGLFRKNSFQLWAESEKLDFISKGSFGLLEKNRHGFLLYKSISSVLPYKTRKGKYRFLEKTSIFLIDCPYQHY